jgi:hypothetical protein
MAERFVSEAVEPVGEAIDTRGMGAGEPGLPRRFVWDGREHEIVEVLESWKTTSGCSHGGGEQYVRRHWFRVRTADGAEMKLYFERQARSARQRTARWWLFTISIPE